MTILDRSAGSFSSATTVTVTRSTGSYGSGTVVVVAIFSNITFSTPSGWTQRTNSVVDLGLYSFDKTAAGESSFAFTPGGTGSGIWCAWELSSGSTWLSGSATQSGSGAGTFTTGGVTPTAGNRHLLALSGGVRGSGGTAADVSSFSDSFTEFADFNVATQDKPFAAGADRDVTANGSTAYSTTATFSAPSQPARGGILLAYVNNASSDVTAPTTPTGLTVGTVTSTTADLSWTASTDAVGVTGYEIEIVGP